MKCYYCGDEAYLGVEQDVPLQTCMFCGYMKNGLLSTEFIKQCRKVALYHPPVKRVKLKDITRQLIGTWTADEMRFHLKIPSARKKIERVLQEILA